MELIISFAIAVAIVYFAVIIYGVIAANDAVSRTGRALTKAKEEVAKAEEAIVKAAETLTPENKRAEFSELTENKAKLDEAILKTKIRLSGRLLECFCEHCWAYPRYEYNLTDIVIQVELRYAIINQYGIKEHRMLTIQWTKDLLNVIEEKDAPLYYESGQMPRF